MTADAVPIIVAAIALLGTIIGGVLQWRTSAATRNDQRAATAINGFQALCDSLQSENARLTSQIDRLRARIADIEADRERLQARIDQLENERAEVIAKYEALKARIEAR